MTDRHLELAPPPDDHAARLAAHLTTAQRDGAAPVVFPQIGLSGSGAQYLAESYTKAADAVEMALAHLAHARPNGRDYPDEATVRAAMADHRQRVALLVKVRDELDALRLHCIKATRERTG